MKQVQWIVTVQPPRGNARNMGVFKTKEEADKRLAEILKTPGYYGHVSQVVPGRDQS